jgi:hypothetical protein
MTSAHTFFGFADQTRIIKTFVGLVRILGLQSDSASSRGFLFERADALPITPLGIANVHLDDTVLDGRLDLSSSVLPNPPCMTKRWAWERTVEHLLGIWWFTDFSGLSLTLGLYTPCTLRTRQSRTCLRPWKSIVDLVDLFGCKSFWSMCSLLTYLLLTSDTISNLHGRHALGNSTQMAVFSSSGSSEEIQHVRTRRFTVAAVLLSAASIQDQGRRLLGAVVQMEDDRGYRSTWRRRGRGRRATRPITLAILLEALAGEENASSVWKT